MSENAQTSECHSPDFWAANKYRLCVVQGDVTTWVEPGKPFALIGAASCCDVKIDGSNHVPPVAYFVCCLRDRIEVWPTAALAYSRWGSVSSDINLLVGRTRITLHVEGHQSNEASASNFKPEPVRCKIKFQAKSVKKILRRSVTLIGDAHPSMLRLRDQGLERCHFAAVVQDARMWLVDVSPTIMPLHERVQSLQDAGDVAHMLGTKIQLISMPSETTTKVKLKSPADEDQALVATTSNDLSAESGKIDSIDEGSSPDALTSIVTDRLINKSRSWWRIPLIVLTLAAALTLVVFLWFNLLQKIYQEWF